MTPEQRAAVERLSGLSYLPASRDKYWVKRLVYHLETLPDQPLTPWLSDKLWYLVHRYRHQHGRCPCLICLKAGLASPYQGSLFEETEVR